MRPLQRTISSGADYIGINDDRFKTARLSVAFLLPLSQQTASANAILPFLLRRSSAEYPSFAALQRRLNQLYGARISGDVSRIGNWQAMVLTAVSIDDRFALHGEKVTLQCAELLGSMIFEPVMKNGGFLPSDTEQEKRCLIELIQSEINEKRLYARHRCEQVLCEGQGYSVNRYGTIDRVAALTSDAAAEAWRSMLRSAHIRVIYHGAGGDELTVDEFSKGIASVSGRIPIGSEKKTSWDPQHDVREVIERMDVNQSKLVMGFRPVGTTADDTPSLRLLNALLGGTPHSLLFKNVRERLSLCYYCSSSYDRLGNVLLVDSGVEEKNASRARDEVLKQLDNICLGVFSEEELESARRSIVNQFQTISDQQSSLSYWYLGQSLDSKTVTPEKAAEEVGSVTREQVIEAARRVKLGAVYLLAGEEGGNG
ncbi:MAG TPA: insulinase family protein [Ruminococcaceae bacterium]|nr:insulinase family protein [Oscillospiraceae bacterium]